MIDMMQSHQNMLRHQRDATAAEQAHYDPNAETAARNETTAQFNSSLPPYVLNESLASLLNGLGSTTFQLPLDVLLFLMAAGLDHKCSAFIRERFTMETIHMAHSDDLHSLGLTADEIARFKRQLIITCKQRRTKYGHIGEASHLGPSDIGSGQCARAEGAMW